ncbi:MAG: Hsp20/alpha crystallin family protein [Tatlockia sp.]|jgi:HSP20 family protein
MNHSLRKQKQAQQNMPMDLFGSIVDRFIQGFNENALTDTSLWNPSIDIKECKSKYLVTADLPGVEDKDLDITLENNVLTIKGERHFDKTEEDEGFSRTERFEGQFYRRFILPESVDSSKIKADYKKGVLKLTIPKQEPAKVKKIEVKHAN